MDIYLPIASQSQNLLVLLAVGGGIGFLSGLFGVSGGFLLTPLLIVLGIPAPVAVASGANQVVGSSVSGVLAHFRRGNVDVKMGCILLVGGLAGSSAGVALFSALSEWGQLDTLIALGYVLLLGTVGGTMLKESLSFMLRSHRGAAPRRSHHRWVHGLPFKTRFRRSRLYISALLPLGVGACVGLLSAFLGVGGGFIMVPAMIYLIGMPTSVVVGTSLFQIVFVTANVAFLYAVQMQTVDVVLVMILLLGGVLGAQAGARFGVKLRGEQLRLMLALIVLAVALKLGVDLVATPEDFYSLASLSPRS